MGCMETLRLQAKETRSESDARGPAAERPAAGTTLTGLRSRTR